MYIYIRIAGGVFVRLQESGEMYLESIYILSKGNKNVHSIDVGEYLGYSKPSVSRAMSLLKTGGYIKMAADGTLTLTELGREIAEKIYERHTVLTAMLLSFGVDEVTAAEDACRLEHAISDKSLEAVKRYLKDSGKI